MHIAFVPARRGSEGFKFKNRLFFDHTANFIDGMDWFDQVICSSNDENILSRAAERLYTVHKRSDELSGPTVSIKSVLTNVVEDISLPYDGYIWLFYLPILYKDRVDFERTKKIIETEKPGSLCTFVPARTHPYSCWTYDNRKRILGQYFSNDIYRRQDYPQAWAHYHYVYCCKVDEISSLNSELLNSKTRPVFLNSEISDKLIEVDTPEDYKKWKGQIEGNDTQ